MPSLRETRIWHRIKERLWGPEHAGATAEETTFARTASRGRVSGDMDSLVDRADWHDRLRDVQVRLEETLDVKVLDIARRFGCYDEVLQALAQTHVHVPDSLELDDAAAPVVELLEAETAVWTAEDQRALEALLEEEEKARK